MIRQCSSRFSSGSILHTLFAAVFSLLFAGASPAFGLEDCPGVTLGKASPSSTTPWVYSSCKVKNSVGPEFYFVIRLNSDNTIQSVLNTGTTLTPSPTGSVVELGPYDFDFGTHTKDMGVGYTGDCTEVDDEKNEKPTAVAGNTYCGRVKVASGNVVAKATFNGTTFSDYSIKHGATPVATPATPVPTLPLFGLGILVSLLGLFGLRKLRQ